MKNTEPKAIALIQQEKETLHILYNVPKALTCRISGDSFDTSWMKRTKRNECRSNNWKHLCFPVKCHPAVITWMSYLISGKSQSYENNLDKVSIGVAKDNESDFSHIIYLRTFTRKNLIQFLNILIHPDTSFHFTTCSGHYSITRGYNNYAFPIHNP